MSIATLLYLAALMLTALCAFGVSAPRVHLGWLGVALVLLAVVLERGIVG